MQLGADRAARVQFQTEDCAWYVVVDEGRVEQLDLGVVDDPDVVVRWSKSVAAAILRGELRDDDAWRATTVSAMTATGPYTGPPAPLDLACRPELDLPVGAPVEDALVGARPAAGHSRRVFVRAVPFPDGSLRCSPLRAALR